MDDKCHLKPWILDYYDFMCNFQPLVWNCSTIYYTFLQIIPIEAATAKRLNTDAPTIDEMPRSPLATKVAIILVKSSGEEFDIPRIVQPAISLGIFNAGKYLKKWH